MVPYRAFPLLFAYRKTQEKVKGGNCSVLSWQLETDWRAPMSESSCLEAGRGWNSAWSPGTEVWV